MVDVADWTFVVPMDLKPGEYILHNGEEVQVRSVEPGRYKDGIKIRLYGRPPIYCEWNAELRRVRAPVDVPIRPDGVSEAAWVDFLECDHLERKLLTAEQMGVLRRRSHRWDLGPPMRENYDRPLDYVLELRAYAERVIAEEGREP